MKREGLNRETGTGSGEPDARSRSQDMTERKILFAIKFRNGRIGAFKSYSEYIKAVKKGKIGFLKNDLGNWLIFYN